MTQRFLIVAARFNELITRSLVQGASDVFAEANKDKASNLVDTVWVPGAFEIPVVAAKAARTGRYTGIVCLGAVIKGETPHFEYVAGPCASALMNISVETGIPVVFGVLTTNTVEEALNRAGLKLGNKGSDAAQTALTMAHTLKQFD